MHTARTCRACGAALAAGAESCPRCLFRLALPADAPRPNTPPRASSSSGTPRPEPPTLEEIARALPEFDELEWLGRGGMGVVYRARQKQLDRRVALKVLPRALGERPEFRERFLREARALARLNHPNIVAVHDFGTADGLCYFVMELVDGVNLRELLREKRLTPAESLAIVRGLCDALQYAHDEGVVHRDIKPENVLVDKAGRVRVADFGLAKLVGDDAAAQLTDAGQVMGTPHYMAPEQLERPLDVDHRADLFALGVVLYEMLTGSLPRGTFEPPSQRVHVDVHLDEIVVKALEREPARRYQHAIEVKQDVERVEAGGAPGVAHRRVTPDASPAQTAERKRGAARAITLSALGWAGVAACWNLGAFAFVLAGIAFTLLAAWILRDRVARDPALDASLRALTRAERSSRVTNGAALFLLALVTLGFFHVAHWESGTSSWSPAYRGATGAYEAVRADPFGTARAAGIHAGPGWTVVVRTLSSRTSESAAEIFASGSWPLFVLAFALAVLAVFFSVRPRERGPSTRAAWHASLDVTSHVFGGIVFAWILTPLLAFGSGATHSAVERRFVVDAQIDDATRALTTAMRDAGLELEVEQALVAMEEHSATPFVNVHIARAAAPSPFKAWSMSLQGPRRATPQVWATIVSSPTAATSHVVLRAGLYAQDSWEASEAAAALARLEDATRRG